MNETQNKVKAKQIKMKKFKSRSAEFEWWWSFFLYSSSIFINQNWCFRIIFQYFPQSETISNIQD
jgi:hypothetical protein